MKKRKPKPERYCNQLKCGNYSCQYHPQNQPWDVPCRVSNMSENCGCKQQD